jgi:proteasome activator subunit 4
MEGDDNLGFDSPLEDGALSSDENDLENQIESMKTDIKSVPYECESMEEMQILLEVIIGKIIVCAKSENWSVLTSWDGALQWCVVQTFLKFGMVICRFYSWLHMRYPMPKSTRAKIVRIYYEMCLIPATEPYNIRGWAEMLSRLLTPKAPKRKLDAKDLQLPWQPLWSVIKKWLWPKKRVNDSAYVILLRRIHSASLKLSVKDEIWSMSIFSLLMHAGGISLLMKSH